jgi:CBS domain-containing protein
VVTREDMKAALAANAAPALRATVECPSTLSVRDVGKRLMESAAGIVLVRDESTGEITSVVTLHDLLRAQVALAE